MMCTQCSVQFVRMSIAVSFDQKEPEWLLAVSWFYQLRALSACFLAVQKEHLQHMAWAWKTWPLITSIIESLVLSVGPLCMKP